MYIYIIYILYIIDIIYIYYIYKPYNPINLEYIPFTKWDAPPSKDWCLLEVIHIAQDLGHRCFSIKGVIRNLALFCDGNHCRLPFCDTYLFHFLFVFGAQDGTRDGYY